jgi:hypothetical protein
MSWRLTRLAHRGRDPFARVVTEVFADAGWTVEVDPAGTVATVHMPEQSQITLEPLREICAGRPQRIWRDLIAEYVLPFVASMDSLPDLSDWSAVRPTLRTRLRHVSDRTTDDHVLGRPLAEGLLETVVVDTPSTSVGFDTGLLNDLSVTPEQVWAAAREQVRRHEPVAVETVELDGHVLTCLLTARSVDSFYVASHLPWIADLVAVGPLGLAVGVPDQRCVVTSPLASPVVPTVRAVFAATGQRHDTRSGGVSPDVYWWRDGVIRRIARTPHHGEDLGLVWTPDYLRLTELAGA